MLQTATNSYVLPLSGGRDVPHHGYSLSSLTAKRIRENTSALAITVGFLLPALNDVNKQLDKHVEAGTDVSVDELTQIFGHSAYGAAISYADRLARVGCQTGLACVFIGAHNDYGNKAVYLWDLYPRLHQRYVGAVLSWLRVPIFLTGLLGPKPTEADVEFLQSPVSGVGAFEDSLRRDAITLVGDLVVDSVRIVIARGVERPVEAIAKQAVLRVTVAVSGALGAGVGRTVAGERGEYWGNIAGVLVGPMAAVQVMSTMRKLKILKPRRTSRPSASGDAAKVRRHRHSSTEGSKSDAILPAA